MGQAPQPAAAARRERTPSAPSPWPARLPWHRWMSRARRTHRRRPGPSPATSTWACRTSCTCRSRSRAGYGSSTSATATTVPPGVPGNALDIGIFDQRGHELGDHSGFRGWSGGFRDSFSISNSQATPGYLPGPIEPGTWNVVLGPYTVAPAGLNWTVQITLTFGEWGPAFVPDFPPTRAKGRGRAWYRGDCHLHTVYSDGRRLPAEVAAGARARKLDFIVSTDHNTSASHGAWGQLAGDDLLIVSGEEITSRNGHFVAAGLPPGTWIDWRYRAQDGELPRFLRDLHHGGAIAVAAHPFAPCLACAWKFGYAGMDAVEVWNGPWTLDDEVAVQLWNGMLVEAAHGGPWLP